MRILFFGSGEFATPTLRWLQQSGHSVVMLASQPPRESGRGRKVTPTPVAQYARQTGESCREVEDVNDASFVQECAQTKADLGLVIAFGQKLGPALRNTTPGGFLNLHASLLPKYRGAAPIHWAVVNGEERTGCSVFRIVEKMDAGPILTTRWTLIKPEETTGELHDRLAAIGVDAVQAALLMFENGIVPSGQPQCDAEATKAPKLTKSDGVVRFDKTAAVVVRQALGMTPWPGATTTYVAVDGERWEVVQLSRIRPVEVPGTPEAAPGTIDSRLHVAVVGGFIEILEIKPKSGRQMTWKEYCNGRRVQAGDHFATQAPTKP